MKLSDGGRLTAEYMKIGFNKGASEREKRLTWYHKWFVTALFILIAVFMIMGEWRSLLVAYLVLHFHVYIREVWHKLNEMRVDAH